MASLTSPTNQTQASLSRREVEVLEAAMSGEKQAVVAHGLGISEQTMKNHLSTIYRKLEVRGLVEAYVRLGWLRPPHQNASVAVTVKVTGLEPMKSLVEALADHAEELPEPVLSRLEDILADA